MLIPKFPMLVFPRSTPVARFLAFLCCSALISGCSAILKPVRSVTHLKGETTLEVSVDAGANGDSPIAVDVVTVDSSSTLKDISKLTASAWFAQKTTLLRMHPSDLHVNDWEWVPGQQLAPVRILNTGVADGVLLFADYTSSGAHSAVLPQKGTVKIEFGAQDFKLLPAR
jgi:type VI secretion system protein